MAGETSTLKGTLPQQAAGMAKGANEALRLTISDNYDEGRKPDYYVYIHSISEQTHTVQRPPIFPRLTLKGKKKGEEYVTVAKLPCPIVVPIQDFATGEVRYKRENTQRLAQDICNPNNLGLDQNATGQGSIAGTENLNLRGLFWSLNEVPAPEELKAAVTRMENHYRNLLEQAEVIEASNPTGIKDQIVPEWHYAADYFGKSYSWHSKMERPVECDQCGEKIKKQGIAFHRMEAGGYCVKDWRKAYEAGVIEANRVPKSKRWEGFYEETGTPEPAVVK